MARRNFFPASLASCSRCCSRSSRNFRNMIQVRSGSRSRSPFKPLSLRMMSRADLSSEPRAWAVVGAGEVGSFALRGIELGLQLGHGGAELLGAAEQLDDVCHGTVPGERRDVKHVGQDELGVAVLGVLLQQLVQDLTSFGAVAVEEVLALVTEPLRALAAGAQRG